MGNSGDFSIGMTNRQAMRNLKQSGVDRQTRKAVKQFLKQDNKKIDNPLELALLNSIKGSSNVRESAFTKDLEQRKAWRSNDGKDLFAKYNYKHDAKGFLVENKDSSTFAYDSFNNSGKISVNKDSIQVSDSGYTADGQRYNREFYLPKDES